jgi:hypothetical protein
MTESKPQPRPDPWASGGQGPTGPGWRPAKRRYLAGRSLDHVLPLGLQARLAAIAALPAGSVLLALLFGFIALPAVMFGVTGYDTSGRDEIAFAPLAPAVQLASVGAVLASVLVAAPIGAFIVRRQVVFGALLTIALAWLIGILTLPVLPSLLGFSYGAVRICFSSCYAWVAGLGGGVEVLTTDARPSGVLALAMSPFYGPLPLLALVIGVCIWAPIVGRRARQSGS